MCRAILFLGLMFFASGCATRVYVLDKTKTNLVWDEKAKEMKRVRGPAGYYALLPLTLASDIATSPVQLVTLALFEAEYQSQTRGRGTAKPGTRVEERVSQRR